MPKNEEIQLSFQRKKENINKSNADGIDQVKEPKKKINRTKSPEEIASELNLISLDKNKEEDIDKNIEDTKNEENKEEKVAQTDDEIDKMQFQLSLAVLERNVDTILNLIEKLKKSNASLSFRDKEDGLTLLHRSILHGSFEITKILVENGAEVNIPNLSGLSSLHLAAQMGDAETLAYLISKSANVMQRDFENRISLHHAVLGGNTQCAEILLATKSVLINHRDNFGSSALHLAAKQESKEFVDLLADSGADVVLFDNFGNRPIDMVPGFSRFHTSKENKLSPSGKKTVKALKKRGGNKIRKLGSDHIRNNANGGSKSYDHRNPSLSANKLEGNLQIAPPVPSLSGTDLRNQKGLMTESDLQLLYYTPRHTVSPKGAQNNNNNNNNSEQQPNAENTIDSPVTGHKKTDKYGFYVDPNPNPELSKEKSKLLLKEEKKAFKWLEIIKNWETKKNSKKILKYCDKGIPDSVRGMVWRLLADCDEEISNSDVQYSQLLERNSTPEVKEQIHKDIHRTMPNHILFEEKGQGRQMLTNVLTAYSVYKPEVGYCQGMGFITAMFLMFMPEEVFFSLHSNNKAGMKYLNYIKIYQSSIVINNKL